MGVPCAVAVQQVLNGTLSEKGVLAPMNSKINDPLIKELKEVSEPHQMALSRWLTFARNRSTAFSARRRSLDRYGEVREGRKKGGAIEQNKIKTPDMNHLDDVILQSAIGGFSGVHSIYVFLSSSLVAVSASCCCCSNIGPKEGNWSDRSSLLGMAQNPTARPAASGISWTPSGSSWSFTSLPTLG